MTISLGTGFMLAMTNGGQRMLVATVDYWSTEISIIKNVGRFSEAIGTFTKQALSRDITFTSSSNDSTLTVFFIGEI